MNRSRSDQPWLVTRIAVRRRRLTPPQEQIRTTIGRFVVSPGKKFTATPARAALLDLDTYGRVINEWKQLADCVRHQLETLVDLNRTLQKEIAKLAE